MSKLFLILTVFGFIFLATPPIINCNRIYLHNYCNHSIWLGVAPNVESSQPKLEKYFYNVSLGEDYQTCFSADPNCWNITDNPKIENTKSWQYRFEFWSSWSGRIWARTDCNETTGNCLTGDCGKLECDGTSGPNGPTTLAQFSFASFDRKTFYQVSHSQGFNVPIEILPYRFFMKNTNDSYDCNISGCRLDLKESCPKDLSLKNPATNETIGCHSPCQAFGTDEFCCRGFYSQSTRCLMDSQWPKEYSGHLNQCPETKKYSFDKSTKTFYCLPDEDFIEFEVNFCPK